MCVPRLSHDVLPRRLARIRVPARHDHGPPWAGESERGCLADAGVRTRDDENAVLCVQRLRKISRQLSGFSVVLAVELELPINLSLNTAVIDLVHSHYHGPPFPDEDAHDDDAPVSTWVYISVDQSRRNVEEVSGPHIGDLPSVRSILKSHVTGGQEAIEVAGSMVVPIRDRFRSKSRSRDEDVRRLERLRPTDPAG